MIMARISTASSPLAGSPTEGNLNRLEDALKVVQHMRMLSLQIGRFLIRKKSKHKRSIEQGGDVVVPTMQPQKRRKVEQWEDGKSPPTCEIADSETKTPTENRMEILHLVGVFQEVEATHQIMQDEISKILEEEEHKLSSPRPVSE